MVSTEVKIIIAATEAFTINGYSSTNMTQVAQAAGVSRQTLYAHFKTKDTLLMAVMRHAMDTTIVDMQAAWDGGMQLPDVIEIFFDFATRKPFMLMQTHPDLKDILMGPGGKAADVAREAEIQKADVLANFLSDMALGLPDDVIASLAEYVVRVAKDLKYSCTTIEELNQMLAHLKETTVAFLSAK